MILELRLQVSKLLLPILGVMLLFSLKRRRSLAEKMRERMMGKLPEESGWKKSSTKYVING